MVGVRMELWTVKCGCRWIGKPRWIWWMARWMELWDGWIRPQSPDRNGRQIWSESKWSCGQLNVDADGFGGSPDRVGRVGSQVDRQKDRVKAAGASVHAGRCRFADRWVSDNWNGVDVEVGVGSDEEHSLMDSPGVIVQWSREVGVWFSVVYGMRWWVV